MDRNLESMPYEFIRELKKNGHQVVPFGFDKASDRLLKLTHFDANYNFLPRQNALKRVLSLRKLIRTERPQFIFCISSLGGNGIISILARSLSFRVPKIIVRITSDHFRVFSHQDSNQKKFKLFIRNNILGLFTMVCASTVVCQHKAQVDFTRKILKWVTDFRVAFQFNKLVYVEAFDLSELKLAHAKSILYLGRVSHDKGVTYLLECIRNTPDLKVNFIFSGEISEALLELAHESSKDERIKFTDQLKKDRIASLLAQCEGYITFSPSEGVSNSLLEACQARCLIITRYQLPLIDYSTHIKVNNLKTIKDCDIHKVDHPKLKSLFCENANTWKKIFNDV